MCGPAARKSIASRAAITVRHLMIWHKPLAAKRVKKWAAQRRTVAESFLCSFIARRRLTAARPHASAIILQIYTKRPCFRPQGTWLPRAQAYPTDKTTVLSPLQSICEALPGDWGWRVQGLLVIPNDPNCCSVYLLTRGVDGAEL